MKEVWLREVKWIVQGHTPGNRVPEVKTLLLIIVLNGFQMLSWGFSQFLDSDLAAKLYVTKWNGAVLMDDLTGMSSEKISSKVYSANFSTKLLAPVDSACHRQIQGVQYDSFPYKTKGASQVDVYHLV